MSRRQLLAMLAVAPPSVSRSASERAVAPNFELRDSRGARRSLSGFRGKVVLLNFWATWCAPCRAEIPLLNRAHQTYSPRGFSVVGVAMDARGWPAVTPFLAEHRVIYPVLLGNAGVARLYGGLEVLPRTLFLDREGRIVASHNALIEERPLYRIIQTLLAEEPAEAGPAK